MASKEQIVDMAMAGIPRVAERIFELPGDQQKRAFDAVELSYLQIALDLDYAEANARRWVDAVMNLLYLEVDKKMWVEIEGKFVGEPKAIPKLVSGVPVWHPAAIDEPLSQQIHPQADRVPASGVTAARPS